MKSLLFSKWFILGLFIGITINYCYEKYSHNKTKTELSNSINEIISLQKQIEEQEQGVNWSKFVDAIAWVESRGDNKAIGDNGKAVGILQIWPIVVDDCNEYLGTNVFNYDDRYNPIKSRMMFNIIADRYNPNRDIKKQIKLWNPRAGEQYYQSIMNKYNELTKN